MKLPADVHNADQTYFSYLVSFYERPDIQTYFDDFATFVGKISGKRILDFGCGIGHFSGRLRRMGNTVLSCDINPYALAYGKEKGYVENTLLLESQHLPLTDRSFDLIFLLDVLEHLDEPGEILTELRRVLVPQGKLMLITPNGLWSKVLGGEKPDPTHVYEFSWREFLDLLAQQKFSLARCQASGLPGVNHISGKFARKLARTLGRFALPIAAPSFWVEARAEK